MNNPTAVKTCLFSGAVNSPTNVCAKFFSDWIRPFGGIVRVCGIGNIFVLFSDLRGEDGGGFDGKRFVVVVTIE